MARGSTSYTRGGSSSSDSTTSINKTGLGMPGYAYGWNEAYGGKPAVPDPVNTMGRAVQGNISNLPGLQQLGGDINAFNTSQLQSSLAAMIPNYAALQGAESGLIQSQLSGQLPADLISQLIQQGAERGVAMGSPGSANAGSAYMRALGLNSIGLQNQGVQNFATLMGSTPMPKQFDMQGMLLTPEDVQAAQMAANMYASAPDPTAAANAAREAAIIPSPGSSSSGGNKMETTFPEMIKTGPGGVFTPFMTY